MAVVTVTLDILRSAPAGHRVAAFPWDFGPETSNDYTVPAGTTNLTTVAPIVASVFNVRRWRGRRFDLPSGRTLALTDGRPFLIEATERISIAGTIEARNAFSPITALSRSSGDGFGGKRTGPAVAYLLTGDLDTLTPAMKGGTVGTALGGNAGYTLVLKAPLITLAATADCRFSGNGGGGRTGAGAGGQLALLGNRVEFPTTGSVFYSQGSNVGHTNRHSDDGDLLIVYRDALVGDPAARVADTHLTIVRIDQLRG